MGFALESFDSGSTLGKGLERKGMMSRKRLTGEECMGGTSRHGSEDGGMDAHRRDLMRCGDAGETGGRPASRADVWSGTWVAGEHGVRWETDVGKG